MKKYVPNLLRPLASVRRCTLPALFFLAALMLSSCAGREKVTVLKLAHGLDPAHPVHRAMEFMAERIHEKSEGRMRLDLYPSEQLGSERECLELLQIGSLGLTKVSSSVLEAFVPSFSVFSLPYLFRDDAHKFAVLQGPVGRDLLLASESYWLRGLTYYDSGSRSFYTKDKPILSPADLQGLKIRTQESMTSIKMVRAMGGSATPISWGELYTSLQQGVVDGAENNPPSFHLSRHYEVAGYFSLDEHTSVPDVLLMSTLIWNGLTPDQQRMIQEAADESAVYQQKLWAEATQTALKAVQEGGVQIFYPDKEPFRLAVAELYESYRNDPLIYELILKIRGTQP